MSEPKPASHADIEEAFRAPRDLVTAHLPDSIESREAKRLLQVTEDLVHRAHEKIRPE